jgi:hypothetical protein
MLPAQHHGWADRFTAEKRPYCSILALPLARHQLDVVRERVEVLSAAAAG